MKAPCAESLNHALVLTGLATLCVLAWLLCHPYQGLYHDANLYALQALARLEPDSLNHDVFLSHGSQDRFTLFSPLYALGIRLLGLDRAAALLTVLSQIGLCVGAWLLTRTRLPRWAAAAGVLLLVALPCEYGPLRIFACVEPYLTPRMAAEALTLGALAAALRGRGRRAACLLLTAMLLHPVMALAGVATLIAGALLRLWATGAAARATVITAGLLVVSLGVALLIAGRFDPEWLEIVQARSPYLFLQGWSSEDWSRALTGLLPLAAGALVLEGPLRRASLSVFLATLAGWLMTLLGADLMQSVVITQAQPWRIEWLSTAVGALLLPWVFAQLWCSTVERRCAALLMLAALVFRTQEYAVAIGLAALAMLIVKPLNPRHARLMFLGAAGMCVLALLWRVASDLEFTDVHYLDATLPLWLRRAMSIAKDGSLLGALAASVLWLDTTRARRTGIGLLGCAALAVSIGAGHFTLTDWLSQSYPKDRILSFDPWRLQVPPQAQVYWSESPLSAWALLRRPHYLSGLQTSGVVFSRAAALDLKKRADRLSSVINPAYFLQWDFIGPGLPLDARALLMVCRLGVIEYLVTEANIALVPMARLAPRKGSTGELKLYQCADPR